MISFTKRYVNFVSLIISIIVFCFLNAFFLKSSFNVNDLLISNKISQMITDLNYFSNNEKINILNLENNIENDIKKDEEKNSIYDNSFLWEVEVPSINLKVKISEGTSKEILDEYVGHFEETKKRNGNIGLAAHNRGYKVNYFQNLKKVKIGDEIIYRYKEFEKKYSVKVLKIVKDTDWSMLENTQDNRITLITCVENEPEYRRVVQAVEI